MFKNMVIYRVDPSWSASLAQIEQSLAAWRFVECGSTQEKSLGWCEPRGQAHGALVESVDGQLLLRLMIETKAVPGAVLMRKTKERLAHIEASSGRKPGRKEARDIKDNLRLELLPQAFTKQSSVNIWIDPKARWLVLDTASQARTDDVVTMLVKSLPGMAVTLVNSKRSPSAAMAEWLVSREAAHGFSVDRECELKAADESMAVVRYARHALDTDEVRQHVRSGKLPTRLALTWNSRVSLVLTENLQIKKLSFLDVVFDNAAPTKDDDFDGNVALLTGELRKLLPDLLDALGGETAPP